MLVILTNSIEIALGYLGYIRGKMMGFWEKTFKKTFILNTEKKKKRLETFYIDLRKILSDIIHNLEFHVSEI